MAKTVAQLNYDNFNIGGEVHEGAPSPYDFELYVENDTIKTKGYEILQNSKVTVENGAMKFAGGTDSYLSLDPEILNGVTDFEMEIKFKPTKVSAEDSMSGIIHFGRIPTSTNADNELGLNIHWPKRLMYIDTWNVAYGSSINDGSFDEKFSLPISAYGDVNISDDFTTVKLIRRNNFLAVFIDGNFKKGYRSLGTLKVDVAVVGCENDPRSSELIRLEAVQAFIGYIEYIKIKNYKTTKELQNTIDYSNFSIQKNGDINVDTIKEGYHDFAEQKGLYYLPDALQGGSGNLTLTARGDLTAYKTIEGGTMCGYTKPTDIYDLTRYPSKKAIKMTKEDYPSYKWNWELQKDAYAIPGWSTGYNSGISADSIVKGYHAKWVKEGPDSKMCLKMIDMNTNFGYPHRWMGVAYEVTKYGQTIIEYGTGDVLTVHFKAKGLKKGSVLRMGFYRTSLSEGSMSFGPNIKEVILSENWEEYSLSFTVDDDWDINNSCSLYIYGHYSSFETITWVSDIIVSRNLEYNMTSEQLHNLTSLGIKFNLIEDIQMDWSKPWTICYWKKPLCETGGKYNLDSLGSNTAKNNGKGYIYVGSNNTPDNLVVRLNGSRHLFPVENRLNKYFGNWIFIALKYDGSKLYCSINGEKFDDVKQSGSPEFTPTANFFDSTHGYDLFLGGYDNANSAAAIFKDLLIAKNSVITDQDLEYLYRSKLNYKNGELISSTNFKETL